MKELLQGIVYILLALLVCAIGFIMYYAHERRYLHVSVLSIMALVYVVLIGLMTVLERIYR